MAVSTKSGGFWSHLHLGIRFVGLTGLFVAGVALVIALVDGLVTSAIIWETWETLLKYARQEPIERAPSLVISLLLGALVAGLFSLFVEILMVLRFVAGRRSAFGFNVVTQIALAVLLLIGINLYSAFGFDLTGYGLDFRTDPHYWRIDTTRGRQFTLPSDLPELPHLANQLRNLQGQTTIVVYQRHKTFGQLSDKPDGYDYAAERKVVEKVNDLVDQFRELGKQFTVIVLDVEEESYADKLNKLHTVWTLKCRAELLE